MKKLTLLMLLPGMLATQNLFAQTDAHLKLSAQYPAAGEKVAITYNPAGTPVDGKKDITAAVFFLDNKDYPVADIELKPDGKLLKGDFTVNTTAKAFFIKISSGGTTDDNDTKGYVYMVYKDKQPVAGAYAMEGYWLSSGMGAALAGIKTDAKQGLVLYKKEFEVYPASEKDYGTNYYYMIARNPEYAEVVSKKVAELEKSSDEKDLIMAANLLTSLKRKPSADSLNAVVKAKFPNGVMAKNTAFNAFYREKDLAKRDSMYQVLSKTFPDDPTEKNSALDGLRGNLASAYLTAGNIPAFDTYVAQMKNKNAVPNYLNSAAWTWAKKGERLADAEMLSKRSLDMLKEKVDHPVGVAYSSAGMAKKTSETMYDGYTDTYAYILLKENKPAEAVKLEKGVYERKLEVSSGISENYALMLAANGDYAKAQEVAATSIKENKTSDVLKEELKKDYIKVKGSGDGYDEYLAGLSAIGKNKAREEIIKTMINKPAPQFTLKDLDGNVVSLASLKGKVVVVDFWATWCGPCKASFPGMQLAVNKFKDDPNVKFLFVDTWENDGPEKYIPGVKKFIDDNKYTFHVLVDEKGDDSRQSKVVSTFGVDGIPTKFIIDKAGNIRFKYVGYSGSTEAVLSEVINMVEITADPEVAAASVPKSTMNK